MKIRSYARQHQHVRRVSNLQGENLNPKPISPKAQALEPETQTPNPKPLNPKPPNSKPYTFEPSNPKPQAHKLPRGILGSGEVLWWVRTVLSTSARKTSTAMLRMELRDIICSCITEYKESRESIIQASIESSRRLWGFWG